ncbi:MAG: sigma-70 family RNA polymerase sigma factor [Acidimicrobiales bacterium]|nr:sigma-70 family RNA polymerase sigma factor [Acidimicrobiales bacterium]MCB1261137.1 sigma-70 family RNA polymerase sigma factor [Acidimicrobiales bacterium]
MDELTELALAAAAGDRRAFDAFVRATAPEVTRLCAHLGDPRHAEDLTQEVYLRAMRALPGFRAESSARTWLLSIARRTCADHVRRQTRRRRLQARLDEQPMLEPSASDDGAHDLEGLVAELPEDFRTAFVLTQVAGLSYAEAAEVVGCPVGTIRSRVARAREGLLSALAAADRATGS